LQVWQRPIRCSSKTLLTVVTHTRHASLRAHWALSHHVSWLWWWLLRHSVAGVHWLVLTHTIAGMRAHTIDGLTWLVLAHLVTLLRHHGGMLLHRLHASITEGNTVLHIWVIWCPVQLRNTGIITWMHAARSVLRISIVCAIVAHGRALSAAAIVASIVLSRLAAQSHDVYCANIIEEVRIEAWRFVCGYCNLSASWVARGKGALTSIERLERPLSRHKSAMTVLLLLLAHAKLYLVLTGIHAWPRQP
jgi:hypothetical protein